MDKFGPHNPLPEAPNEATIPPQNPIKVITPEEADSMTGCWLDGANRGHYLNRDIIYLALNKGWVDEEAERLADQYESSYADAEYPYEVFNEAADDAEVWLNEAVAPPGYSFGVHDGSFFFMRDQWFCDGEEGGYCDDADHQHEALADR